MGYGMIEIAE